MLSAPTRHASSYAHGGGGSALIGETIGQALRRIAMQFEANEALVSIPQDRRFTYREFDDIVDRAARSFIQLGIARGDRVAIWSTNNYEWVVAQFATARIGAVLVNINPAYRSHELEYVLRASRSKALLLIESFKSSNYVEMFYELCPEARDAQPGHIDSWRFPQLKTVIFIGNRQHAGMLTTRQFVELGDDLGGSVIAEREALVDIDDVINIQYTSGTTGFPKGVALTHHNILNNGFQIGEMLGLCGTDRVCVAVPFYHCFGMVVTNLAALTHGATLVIPARVFDALATLTAVQQERCTVLHGVPTMFIAELDHPEFDTFDLSSLRTGIMAGAPCPAELMDRVIKRMHMPQVCIAYGMTESSPVTTMTRQDTTLHQRVHSVGLPMPHAEIKIVDPLSGHTLPRNCQGEICFRGYMVMRGYDQDTRATRQAIDEHGWLHSGDLGVMDEANLVSVTGRIKDMIIRGGENIYPREIEEFLHTFDIIEDAYVVGVPDPKYGEELLACVKLQQGAKAQPPGTDALRSMCEGKIAHFKIPKYWLVVDEFPMTVTGKVQKFKIRELAVRQLQLG